MKTLWAVLFTLVCVATARSDTLTLRRADGSTYEMRGKVVRYEDGKFVIVVDTGGKTTVSIKQVQSIKFEGVEQTKIVLPSCSIYDEDIHDVPLKTQVTLKVLVSGDITRPGLTALLNKLCSSTSKRTGFKHHDSPTNIYIYAFTSKEKGTSGWIALL